MTIESKILLIGDSCIDRYVFVEKTRHNPENDAPLLTELNSIDSTGMADNVYRCIKNLLLNVTAIVPDKKSIKTRYIDCMTGEQYFRTDKDFIVKPIEIETIPLNEYNCIVVSDYNKGYITKDTLKYIQENFSGPKFLDTKKPDLSAFEDYYIKINETEAIIAKESIPRYSVITMGAFGAIVDDGFREHRYKALEVNCVDVCGAGDAFLAGYVYGFLKTETLNSAIIHGIVNSGISVTQPGTYAPLKEELEEGLIRYAKQVYQYPN
jgi:bifunctional ADP-heptose synthase (sugar kinase/adenylyltransferase)